MNSHQTLLCSSSDGILTVTMNRPEVFNALNEQMKTELNAVFATDAAAPDVRCVVLRGAGDRAFCSGQDLKEHGNASRSLRESLQKQYNPLILKIRQLEKPVIAMINGVAAGAGCSLALACDMRFMSASAKLIEVFIRIGLVPDSGSHWFLPRLAGMARAFEYAATGRDIGPEEAERAGLVNAVAQPEALEAETMSLARTLASGPTRSIGLIKRTLNQAMISDLPALLEYEAMMQEIASRTADHREGIAAFLEKRKARFTGR